MSPHALRSNALQDGHEARECIVPPSRLKGRRVEVRRKPRGAYSIDRPGRVALRRIRQGKGWSQQDLALRAGVCVGTVQGMESGASRRLFRHSLAGLGAALGLGAEKFEELLNLPIELGDGEAAA